MVDESTSRSTIAFIPATGGFGGGCNGAGNVETNLHEDILDKVDDAPPTLDSSLDFIATGMFDATIVVLTCDG